MNKGISEAPADGVTLAAECVRTDFYGPIGKPDSTMKQSKNEARISASCLVGTFSIRDVNTGVMLSVNIDDAMAVIQESAKRYKEIQQPTAKNPS